MLLHKICMWIYVIAALVTLVLTVDFHHAAVLLGYAILWALLDWWIARIRIDNARFKREEGSYEEI